MIHACIAQGIGRRPADHVLRHGGRYHLRRYLVQERRRHAARVVIVVVLQRHQHLVLHRRRLGARHHLRDGLHRRHDVTGRAYAPAVHTGSLSVCASALPIPMDFQREVARLRDVVRVAALPLGLGVRRDRTAQLRVAVGLEPCPQIVRALHHIGLGALHLLRIGSGLGRRTDVAAEHPVVRILFVAVERLLYLQIGIQRGHVLLRADAQHRRCERRAHAPPCCRVIHAVKKQSVHRLGRRARLRHLCVKAGPCFHAPRAGHSAIHLFESIPLVRQHLRRSAQNIPCWGLR